MSRTEGRLAEGAATGLGADGSFRGVVVVVVVVVALKRCNCSPCAAGSEQRLQRYRCRSAVCPLSVSGEEETMQLEGVGIVDWSAACTSFAGAACETQLDPCPSGLPFQSTNHPTLAPPLASTPAFSANKFARPAHSPLHLSVAPLPLLQTYAATE